MPFAKRRADSSQEQRLGQASWWHVREDAPVLPGRAAAGPGGSVHILLPRVGVGAGGDSGFSFLTGTPVSQMLLV